MEILNESDEALKEKLLRLIEEGDATAILSSEYTESLNELIKHEFIAIENDALQLTDKGREAKLLGIKNLMERSIPAKEEIKIKDFSQPKIAQRISNQSFLIILFFFLVSLLAMLTAL